MIGVIADDKVFAATRRLVALGCTTLHKSGSFGSAEFLAEAIAQLKALGLSAP